MADNNIENDSSWTVFGSKEAMEVLKNFKDLQKLGVRNVAQYSAENVPYPVLFCSTSIHFFHTLHHICGSVWPAKEANPRFGTLLVHSVHDCETGLIIMKNWHQLVTTQRGWHDPHAAVNIDHIW